MVEFAGWWMPIQFTSIVEEHRATRERAGLFDISHMGRIRFRGASAPRFLDRMLTRRVTDLKPGGIRYSLVTNDQGGILDDVLIYRMLEPADEYLLVVNASNRLKLLDWFGARTDAAEDLARSDETESTAMIAVQGPAAIGIVNTLIDAGPSVDSMKYYASSPARVAGVPVLLSRTGYTGEDGCELVAPAESVESLWATLLRGGEAAGAVPVGLGARDTLRLEGGMPLYGHELTESINPFEADLAFAVNLGGRAFPGSNVLESASERPTDRVRIGLTVDGKRVPREGFEVFDGDQRVGEVTSGTFSPTFERPIAMAFVRRSALSPSRALTVDIRGKRETARITRLPFYRRTR